MIKEVKYNLGTTSLTVFVSGMVWTTFGHKNVF